MALFKIFNNFGSNTSIQNANITHNAGYCYFDKTTGKFWIDTSSNASDMLQLGGTFFGTCSSLGSATTKVVENCPGFVLYAGASIYVKFVNENSGTVADLQLNVNGTGARPIKRTSSTSLVSAGSIAAGMVCNFVYDGTNWLWVGQMDTDTNTVPTAYCTTVANSPSKVATCTDYTLQNNSYIHILFKNGNSSAGALTLNINGQGAMPIKINGSVTGQSNYTLPAGTYLAYYDGSAYNIRTDGALPGVMAGNVASITNDGSTITYTMGDGTTASFVVPNTRYTAGSAIDITDNQIINKGVRAVGQGTENGTISVNTGGTTRNVTVKGLNTAAYHSESDFAQASHAHGYVSNTGLVTSTVESIGNGDAILIADASAEDKLIKSTLTFDGTTTNQFLTKAGTWEGAEVYSHPAYTPHAEGLYKITVDNRGHVSTATTVVKADITALGIPAQDTTYEFDGTYNSSSNKAATVSSITSRINALDGTVTGTPGAGKTLTTFSQTDGKVTATFGDISVTKSQISDFEHEHDYAGSDTSGGNAFTANYAITAGNAVNAANATNANEAKHAGSAGYALNAASSQYARNAASAQYARNAASAQYARNAASAGWATYAASAGYAINAASSTYATSAAYANLANTANTSGTASWAVTAGNARYAGTANNAVTAGNAVTAANAVKAAQDANGNVINTTYATKDEVNALLGGADAMIFKGTIGTNGTVTSVPTSGYQAGWTYRVITAGTYANQKCEIGDLLIAISDAEDGQTAINNAHWTVAQTNIDGAVTTSQTSATSGSFAIFSGATTGKVIVKAVGVGNASKPIYIDANGVPQTITSYEGKAGSAGYAASAAQATHSASAQYSVYASSAGYAASATQATHAASANYAMSAAYANDATKLPLAGGTMTGNLGIKIGDTDKHIIFDYDGDGTPGASWRIAALGTGTADANYFVIDSGSSTVGSTTWTTAIRIGQNTFDTAFGGNVYPIEDNTKTLGTSSNKWQSVYATNFVGNASSATTAGNAKYAASAGYAASAAQATHAASANYSTSAGYATNATTAKNSGSAGYAASASQATYAASAGYANVANSANTSGTASWAVTAGNAKMAASAAQATHAASAQYAVSSASAGFATTASYATINGIEYIIGTQTGSTNAWLGTTTDSELFTGKAIAYQLPFAGTGTAATLNLTLADGTTTTGAKNVIINNLAGLTTHYSANSIIFMIYDGTQWRAHGQWNSTYYYESIYVATGAGTAAKVGTSTNYTLESGKYFQVLIVTSNTSKSALTLNINNKGAKPIYINGAASSASNYTLPSGYYLVYYDGTNYYFRTDSKMTGNITGQAGSAAYAASAANATFAASAGYANQAANATHADSAGYAASAAQATHAASANYALSASSAGYAASAAQATHAASANYALSAGSAGYAASAARATYAASANYTVNAGSAGYAASAARATYAASANYAATVGTHNHSNLVTIGDQRSTATTPNDYNNKLTFAGLKSKDIVNSPSEDMYSYVVGLRGWGDSSGGDSHELAFNNTGIMWRHGSTTAWGAWSQLVTNTGSWAINITGKSGSAGYAASAAQATHSASANYSASAAQATHAASAQYSISSASAGYAASAAQATHAASAGYAASAAQATHAASANYSTSAGFATKAAQDGSGNTISATYATKTELNNLIAGADAMVYKGTLSGAATTTYTPAANRGDTYRVDTAGLINGQPVEVGDMFICCVDSTAAGSADNIDTVQANWNIIQTNIDGVVTTTQTSSTSGAVAIFTGTGGQTIIKAASVGSSTKPIYFDTNGVPQTISSYEGKSGSAGYAASAAQATHAASANYSASAAQATHSASAQYSINSASAGYAASAAQATHSASAQYAIFTASAGYAASAAQATHAASAQYAISAASAGYAASAAQATHSASAQYAINSASAGYSASAAQATHAASAQYAISAASAGYAASAAQATHAASANYSMSAAQATHAASANYSLISSTNSTSKLFMLGATSQAASGIIPYSHQYVYETDGALSAAKVGINAASAADKVTLQFNSTTNALDFIFA